MLWHAARALPFLCLSFLFFTPAGSAQPSISDVKVEAISHGTVAIRFQVSGFSGTTENWVEYGPSHVLGYRTAISRTGSASPFRSLAVGGLRPDTDYYFRVVVASLAGAASATWYCSGGEAGPGYLCDGPDAPPHFRTAPDPGERPVQPTPPQVTEHPFPMIDGERFEVAIDEHGVCIDFQATLEAAAAADPQRNHEVVIPAGATCYGEFILPHKRGSGVVVVRPSTPLDRLPPPGVRIDPSYRPLMATLSAPRPGREPGRWWGTPLSTLPSFRCEDPPCSEGWRFVGLEITHPDHTEIPATEARIVSFSAWKPGYTLITLDREHSFGYWQSVAIAGVGGAPAFNGIHPVIPVDKSSFAMPVEWGAGGAVGGYVMQAISIPVESCGAGPRPVCRTSIPHGLPQPEPARIESIKDAALKAKQDRPWPWVSTVEVRGAPKGYNGIWGAYRSPDGLQLVTGPSPAGSCEGDCGTAVLRPSVQAFGFGADSGLNGSRFYTVLNDREVQFDDVQEATPEAAGGFLTIDPNGSARLVMLEATGRNIVLDRCWIHGRGFPSRLETAVALSADDSAMIDSVVSDINSWRPITPQGGAADAGAHGIYAATARAVTLGDASRVEIRNNLFENCIGITIYAEQYRSTPNLTPSDITIAGNTLRNDDRFRAGSAESNGRYYPIRHAIELKRGQRVSIDGNLFDGNWADQTPLGPAIELSTRGGGQTPNNQIQDIAIRNNVFRRVSTAIKIAPTDDQIDQPSLPAARVAIRNNLFEDVDFYRMRSRPSGVGGVHPSSNFGGQILFLGGSMEDLTFTHNTAIDNRGKGPTFFWYQGGRSSGVSITDNVFTHNDDFGLGGLPAAGRAAQFEAPLSGPPSTGFDHVFTQTPNPDPASSFARNLVLPGVRTSSNPAAYDDGATGNNFTTGDCQAFYAGFPEIECAGSGQPGETAAQRFAAAFSNLSDPRDPKGRGADLDQLPALSSAIREVTALARERGASIEFRTAAQQPCFVDLSTGPEMVEFERKQTDGGDLRTASFDNLAAGGVYRYRITCAADAVLGEVDIPAH